MVSRISDTEVQLHDGTTIATRTVVWAGGVTCNGTIASTLDVSINRAGRLMVDRRFGFQRGVIVASRAQRGLPA
jgi:NADH dehydrogenase FAD-containing subunit